MGKLKNSLSLDYTGEGNDLVNLILNLKGESYGGEER
jgi:hypothetical protein